MEKEHRQEITGVQDVLMGGETGRAESENDPQSGPHMIP